MKKPEVCALTSQQEKLWSDTRVALLWHCPAFSHILYSMLDTTGGKNVALFTKDVPIAATDGKCVMFNPETYFKYTLNERVFILAHEIMHCVWNHCVLMHQFRMRGKVSYSDGASLPYDQMVMNVATDLVINDALIESKVGSFPKEALHDTSIATAKDSALDAYRKLFKQQPGGGQGQGKGQGQGQGQAPGQCSGQGQGQGQGQGFDEHLAPGTSQGKDATQASQERNESEWQTAIAAAANAARVQGKLPAGLERLFSEILNPQVDWREKIESLFARKVGSGTFDWRKPDRRMIVRDIYAPGRSGFGAGTVVVAVDTSGSIGDKELNMFFAEMAGILEDVRPKQLFVVWCDAKVHRVDEADEPGDLNAIRHKGAPGGGGTSFVPVFDWMAENQIEPDALVYLTDGMGSFPNQAPSFPVIWGSIYPDANYPFGDVVDVPRQAA